MKQNLRKKALFPAIAMVLAAIIALSGVTYAWFTTGTTANVQSLDVNVATANGIQLSLDGTSWKSTITADDIRTAIGSATAYPGRVIQFPAGEIAPVSSAGNVVNGMMEMFYGAYNDNGNLDSKVEVEENRSTAGNFIAFDLFFKTSSAQDLYLATGEGMSFVKTINLSGSDVSMGTDKAVRVAFVPMGTSDDQGEILSASMAKGKAIIWEPNADTRAPGVAGSGIVDYSGFTAKFSNVPETSLGEGQVEAVSPIYSSKIGEGGTVVINMDKAYSKVRVYIWLEGQDVDCINNISNGDFSVSLQFGVIPPEKTETPTESTGDNG